MPSARRYMLSGGKWCYQLEWSDNTNMRPAYEMTAEDSIATNQSINNGALFKVGAITPRNSSLSR